MPPLWLIAGAVILIGSTSVIDRLLLNPRSHTVVVDGKSMRFRRKRDTTLLAAFQGAALAVLLAIVLARGGPVLLIFVLPLCAAVAWWFWSALRMGEALPPTADEVKAGRQLMRKLWPALAVLAVQVPFMIASRIAGGTLGLALTVVDMILGLIVLWLFFLYWRAAWRMRRGASGSTAGARS